MIFVVMVLAAGLVMAGGVWVAVVLVATVARAKRPAGSSAENPPTEKPSRMSPDEQKR
jgi:hypothetical protein